MPSGNAVSPCRVILVVLARADQPETLGRLRLLGSVRRGAPCSRGKPDAASASLWTSLGRLGRFLGTGTFGPLVALQEDAVGRRWGLLPRQLCPVPFGSLERAVGVLL